MPQPDSLDNKSLWLTLEGLQELETQLEKDFNEGKDSPSHSVVAEAASIDRGTVAKIRNRSAGVTLSKLNAIIALTDISLTPGVHYEEYTGSAKAKTPSKSSSRVESQPPDLINQLKECLQSLNYDDQVNFFDCFESEGVSAGLFTLHGLKGGGQKWLVNRLVYGWESEISTSNKISFTLRDTERGIEELWRQLASSLELKTPEPAQLVQEVFRRWQLDTVVLVIHRIERLPSVEWPKFIQQFWHPLMECIKVWNGADCGYKVLFFLVNHVSDRYDGELEMATELSCQWDICQPLFIPAIEDFDEKRHLRKWVSRYRKLPNLLSQASQLQKVTQELFQEGRRGVPEWTLEAIAERCYEGSWEKICRTLDL